MALLGAPLSAAAAAPSRAPHAAAAAPGWTLVWGDEFNGRTAHNTQPGTGVDTAQWTYDIGQGIWGTGEIESMTNSTANVYQDGGTLVIKAIRDNTTANQPDKGWTSGRIETLREDFGAPAGGEVAFESRIQDPNLTGAAAAGYWPAFWMLGTPFRHGVTWPGGGEIDAMENVNGIDKVWGTLHCGVAPGGPCNEFTGRGGNTPCPTTTTSTATCQNSFHTYRVEIDRSAAPEEVRWYVDGHEYWHVSANDPGMDPTTWANAVDHPFFIIFDLVMGGGFPDNVPQPTHTTPTDATQSGAPCASTTSACTRWPARRPHPHSPRPRPSWVAVSCSPPAYCPSGRSCATAVAARGRQHRHSNARGAARQHTHGPGRYSPAPGSSHRERFTYFLRPL